MLQDISTKKGGLDKRNVSGKLVIPTKKCVDLKSILPYLIALRTNKENIDLSYEFITKDGETIENGSQK
jgi:hypothetical protein